MKKTFLGLLALCAGLFLLAGCSSDTLEGTYYRVYNYEGVVELRDDYNVVVLEETTGTVYTNYPEDVEDGSGQEFTVDLVNHTISANGYSMNFVVYEDNIIYFEDENDYYVKVDSDMYDKILNMHEKEEKFDFDTLVEKKD